MSHLQDYYPAIRQGKKVYIPINHLSKDDVHANCGLMLAAATNYIEQFEFDAAEHLMAHEEQLRNYFDKSEKP